MALDGHRASGVPSFEERENRFHDAVRRGQDAAEKIRRSSDLAGRYTATELAKLAADLEAQLVGVRVKLAERTAALHSIAAGDWTREGAMKVAQEALDA